MMKSRADKLEILGCSCRSEGEAKCKILQVPPLYMVLYVVVYREEPDPLGCLK